MPKFKTSGEESRRRQAARMFVVAGVFAFGFGILVCRAIFFHLKENDKLQQVAMRQYRTAVQQSTRRGKILDAVGRELAVDVQVASIYANPRAIADPVLYAKELSRVLGVDRAKLESRLVSKRKFTWVQRRVSKEKVKAVHELKLDGVHIMHENKRAYPNGKLASPLLGAVGFEEALGGIESAFNDLLVSKQAPGEYRRDARGHLYLSPSDFEEAVRLAEIELTIDKTLQYIAERALETGVKAANAESGIAIMVDPTSGEILAMANVPAFDPNHYNHYDSELWKNRAISDAYEPGSTFKVLVVAAALDTELVHAEDVFDCERGRLEIGRGAIRDTHEYGKLNVHEIIKFSSNIGAAKIGQRLAREDLYKALHSFGFGKETGVILPGEATGILPSASQWSDLGHATISFGQGVSATPLQMTMAFAAVANGGELLKPRIIKRIITAEGEERKAEMREVVSHPIRPETARLMTRMLESVVKEEGTGTLAASQEYTIAGKTGTAQKVDAKVGGYASGKYYSSFIGFAPSENPRVVVYVGINEPKGTSYYGGQIAAPVFRRIAEESLHYLKVPSRTRDEVIQTAFPPLPEPQIETRGSSSEQVVSVSNGQWRIPDFRGLTIRGVMESIGNADLKLIIEGTGFAVAQVPRSGSVLPSGAECKVVFQSML